MISNNNSSKHLDGLLKILFWLFRINGFNLISKAWSYNLLVTKIIFLSLVTVNCFLVALFNVYNSERFSLCLTISITTLNIIIRLIILFMSKYKIHLTYQWIMSILSPATTHDSLPQIYRLREVIFNKCGNQSLIIVKSFIIIYSSHIIFSIFVYPFFSTNALPYNYYFMFLSERTTSITYIITYIIQTSHVFQILINMLLVDAYYVIFVSYGTFSFELLNESVKLLNNFNYTKNDIRNIMRTNKFRQLPDAQTYFIQQLVKMHDNTLRGIKLINNLFKQIILCSLVYSLISQCFCYYAVQKGGIKITLILFTILYQIFVHCYFANRLLLQAEKLPITIYNLQWYKLTIPQQRLLLIFLHKAQQPVGLTILGYKDLSLSTFATVCKTALSYCAVLQRVISK